LAVCTLFRLSASGQPLESNLISNPSLDEVEECPENYPWPIFTGYHLSDWWYGLNRIGNAGSSGYVNTCSEQIRNGIITTFGDTVEFEMIQPRTGSGYFFITTLRSLIPDHSPNLPASQDTLNRRFFLNNSLVKPLEMGNRYLFLFYQRGARWKRNTSFDDRTRYECASPGLGAFFSTDSSGLIAFSSTRAEIFSVQPQIEWSENYPLNRNQWTLMAGCFTAEGGERFMTLGRFNEQSESDLEGCRDFLVKNNGDTIFTDFQTERLFVDDFGLYDLDAFTFEDQAHCLLDSFYFEDPYDMGFVAIYEGDTLNRGWSPPGPGLYEIDVMIGACNLEKSFEIEVSPCSSCLPEIAPVELCPGQDYFNPRDYVATSFQVVDSLIKACPNGYAFPVYHPHCSEPIDILEIEVLDYAECFENLPLGVQCVGSELQLPTSDRFILDVGGYDIPAVWTTPLELPYRLADSVCAAEVESGTMRVIECEDCDIYIPNVFSPNGDGINDYFEISTACDVQSAQVQIFDRQGRLIRESRQLDRIWDGRQEQPGVYIYRAQIEHTVAEGTQIRNLSGSLTLVR